MRTIFVLLVGFFMFTSCNQAQQAAHTPKKETATQVATNFEPFEKLTKSAAEWQQELNKQEFYVLREAGTERAGTGDLLSNKKTGTYVCRGCQLPLFSSATKYESGTGWPSFFQPIKANHVADKTDRSHGWSRVEVLCARCDGHLGHVFEDGPEPTGLRYCINSVSLDFVETIQGKK